MMCAGCGVVVDIDPIYYAGDKLPAGAEPGTIIGAKVDGRKTSAVTPGALVGRDARRGEQGEDARGMRLEIRMDDGGRRFIEIADGMRIHRRDRVRMADNRIEVID